jgi:hypothetical protein
VYVLLADITPFYSSEPPAIYAAALDAVAGAPPNHLSQNMPIRIFAPSQLSSAGRTSR